MAPSITAWIDLGNWTALHGQFGTEFGLESGDTELICGLALTHTFQGPLLFDTDQCCSGKGANHDGHDHHQAFAPGMTSWILELTGATGLSGEKEGFTFFELLPGISYTPVERIELRFGVRFLSSSRLDWTHRTSSRLLVPSSEVFVLTWSRRLRIQARMQRKVTMTNGKLL